jgi:hypothetical protein
MTTFCPASSARIRAKLRIFGNLSIEVPTAPVFPYAYYFKDGYLHPRDAVGHGVDIDEQEAEKLPYQRAYLPISRLEDGSMFNW